MARQTKSPKKVFFIKHFALSEMDALCAKHFTWSGIRDLPAEPPSLFLFAFKYFKENNCNLGHMLDSWSVTDMARQSKSAKKYSSSNILSTSVPSFHLISGFQQHSYYKGELCHQLYFGST